MKIFARLFGVLALSLALVLGITCYQVSAHDFWLQIRDYTPEVGENVTLTLGYGHYVPAREFMPNEYLEDIYMLDQKGNKIAIKRYSGVEYSGQKPLAKEGTYLVVAKKKGGFFTKTTEGYKRGHSKKGLKNVIKCTYSEKYAKAIVTVGKGNGNVFSKKVGHKLEILPLVNPSSLREGDYMPIKVIYEGKPLGSEYVFGTYMGFSTEKNAFAYATKTNVHGIAKVKILKSGVWLIIVRHIVPYPDPKECDKISCSSALTFEVK